MHKFHNKKHTSSNSAGIGILILALTFGLMISLKTMRKAAQIIVITTDAQLVCEIIPKKSR